MVYGVVDAGIVEVGKVVLNAPPVPIGTVCVTPLMVIETSFPGTGNVFPLPITPARLIEAVPAVIACDGVSPLNVARRTPSPLRGALCVELATPFVLVIVTSAVRAPVALGLSETCTPHEAPPARVAGGTGQPLTKEKS